MARITKIAALNPADTVDTSRQQPESKEVSTKEITKAAKTLLQAGKSDQIEAMECLIKEVERLTQAHELVSAQATVADTVAQLLLKADSLKAAIEEKERSLDSFRHAYLIYREQQYQSSLASIDLLAGLLGGSND